MYVKFTIEAITILKINDLLRQTIPSDCNNNHYSLKCYLFSTWLYKVPGFTNLVLIIIKQNNIKQNSRSPME